MEFLALGIVGVFLVLGLAVSMMFRRVVSTNEVHIVQSHNKTTSFGKDTANGNSYYEWPSFLPIIGIQKVVLPVNIFDLDLSGYEAYDKGRLPFNVDVKAFFRIADSNIAAQRVSSFAELHEQLKAIVQGAVRTILASNEIEEIMQGRSKFGDEFTKEVSGQLVHWGVETVKNIELMDIRDSANNNVIKNIMEKKKSLIEMESRQEVAKNHRAAQIAEIEADKEVKLQQQTAAKTVGLETVNTNREVEIAKQAMSQEVQEQMRLTKDKEMSVLKVQHVRSAEIQKDVELVKADQVKQTTIINSQGQKEAVVLQAEGQLEMKKREAEAIALEGTARADAETAMQLAPVKAQVALATEIGNNQSYQQYLITIRQVEANQAVGIEQAKAMTASEIKIIANAGSPADGISKVADLFSSKGGIQLGAMLEGLSNTDTGKQLLQRTGITKLVNT